MCLRWSKLWTYIRFPTHAFRKLVHSAQAEHSITLSRDKHAFRSPARLSRLCSLRALSILFGYSCAYFVHQTAVYRPDGKLSNRFVFFFFSLLLTFFAPLSRLRYECFMFIRLFGFQFTENFVVCSQNQRRWIAVNYANTKQLMSRLWNVWNGSILSPAVERELSHVPQIFRFFSKNFAFSLDVATQSNTNENQNVNRLHNAPNDIVSSAADTTKPIPTHAKHAHTPLRLLYCLDGFLSIFFCFTFWHLSFTLQLFLKNHRIRFLFFRLEESVRWFAYEQRFLLNTFARNVPFRLA